MKNLIKFCLVAIMILLPFSCDQDSIDTNTGVESFNKSDSKSTVDVFSPTPGLTVQGTSTLHRNKNGITVNFKTNGLTPGHAVTLWWVIWNNPEYCNTPGQCGDIDFGNAEMVKPDVLYAAGHVVGANGIGNFSAHLNENDDSGSINALFGLPLAGGLLDAQKAEVHLVIRTHGPAVPGIVNEQISSYEGGCDNPFMYPPFTFNPDAIGECADIIASIHIPN